MTHSFLSGSLLLAVALSLSSGCDQSPAPGPFPAPLAADDGSAEPGRAPEVREEDWNGDGVAEVREHLDTHGRVVLAEHFAGTVDAFTRVYTYDDLDRVATVETFHVLDGRTTRAARVYDDAGGLIEIHKAWIDASGAEEESVRTFEPPCAPPYRCADDC